MYELTVYVNHKFGKETFHRILALSENKESLEHLITLITPEIESYNSEFFKYIKEYNYEKSFDLKFKVDLAKKYTYIKEYKLFKELTRKFSNFILNSNKTPISFVDFEVDFDFSIVKTDIKII